MQQIGKQTGGDIHFTATTEKSGKNGHPGHTRNQFNGKKQQQTQVVTKEGDAGDPEEENSSDEPDLSDNKEDLKPCHCYCCGSSDHPSERCRNRVKAPWEQTSKKRMVEQRPNRLEPKEGVSKKKRRKTSWTQYVRKDDRGSDEESEALMVENDSTVGLFESSS